jgi:hypothetical protein
VFDTLTDLLEDELVVIEGRDRDVDTEVRVVEVEATELKMVPLLKVPFGNTE